jgi:uridylate kinase
MIFLVSRSKGIIIINFWVKPLTIESLFMPQYPLHQSQNKRAVISLGGSLIVEREINTQYLASFRKFILSQLEQGWRFFIITGGGSQARTYIKAASEIMGKEITKDDQDWLGIHATRFNAHLVRTIFRNQAQPEIVTDPEEDKLSEADIVIGAGWKPGWSSDYVATKIAQRVGATYIINLSNIKQVYTDDPKKNPDAKPIDKMSWADFRKMVGDEWTPGMNSPYDPIAAKLAQAENQTVLVMDGVDLENLTQLFTKGEFVGTVLSND